MSYFSLAAREQHSKVMPDSGIVQDDREALESSLLELIQQCKAVIACRVSPLQVRGRAARIRALVLMLAALMRHRKRK